MNSTTQTPKMTTPKRFTEKEMKKIVSDRRKGFFKTEETLRDVGLAYAGLGKDDTTIFLHRQMGMMMMMNQREMLAEMKRWKELGCVVKDYNTRRIEIDGKEAWLWTLQPREVDEDTPMCPVSLAYGVMVSGFGYISKTRDTPDLATYYLTGKRADPDAPNKEGDE